MVDRITAAFEALDRIDAPLSWDDVEARGSREQIDPLAPEVQPSSRGSRRRIAWTAIVAAAMVVAVIVVFVVRTDDDPKRSKISASVDSTVPVPTPTTEAETRTSRTFPVVAWTGSTYIVWSGEAGQNETSGRADGWTYDPATGSTATVPVAPIAPRSEAVGVWTGDELLVCCGGAIGQGPQYATATAAAFDPDDGSWRRLADPPPDADRTFGTAVWTGSEMIVVFGNGDGPPSALSYNPANDVWRRLSDPPGSLARIPESAWTGREVIVWSSAEYAQGSDRGYRYDPGTDTWSSLPDVPDASATINGSIAWTGDEIIVYGASAADDTRVAGARWREGETSWRDLANPELPPVEWYEGTPGSQTLAWDDGIDRLVVWPAHGDEGFDETSPLPLLTFDPQTTEWRQFDVEPLGYHPTLLAHDGVVMRADRDDAVVARLSP